MLVVLTFIPQNVALKSEISTPGIEGAGSFQEIPLGTFAAVLK
jgi:hypothetical protein